MKYCFIDNICNTRTISIRFIFLLMMLHVDNITAQSKAEIRAIKSELHDIFNRDQMVRSGKDSVEYAAFIDSCNLAQVEKLIATYGWMGKSTIGEQGNITLWVVIQHADLQTQEKYFPLLQQSVASGESRPQDLALLQDRILMRQGKQQIYGSQVVFNKTTGAQEFYPIEDEKKVNERRKKMGLEPIEKYAEYFGIDYKLSVN